MPRHYIPRIALVCKACSVTFFRKPKDVSNSANCFCSRSCYMSALLDPLEDRFWSRVIKSDGCWLWTGEKVSSGYGKLGMGGVKSKYAHRLSWELNVGPITKGMFVCHHCDNPPCVRPDHLFLGNHLSNAADMVKKDRQCRGERNGRAKLTSELVREIRTRYANNTATQLQLAIEFGLTDGCISMIINFKLWKHLK